MEKVKNKRNIVVVAVLGFLAVLSSCSSVKTSPDKGVNLSGYKTYAWKEPDIKADSENPLFKRDLVEQTIKDNVESELSQKGLTQNDQNPDMYVKYYNFVQNVDRVNTGYYGYGSPWPYYSGYGWGGYGWGGGYGYGGYWPTTYTVTEQTMVIEFIDSRTNKVIWRGTTKDDVTNTAKIDKTLQKDVHAIMKKYPS